MNEKEKKKKHDASLLNEDIENYGTLDKPDKEPVAKPFVPETKPDGNGYDPSAKSAAETLSVHKLSTQKTDLNTIIEKIANPKDEEKLRLSKIKPAMTRKMVILDIQQYLDDIVRHRKDKDFKIEKPLKVLQHSVALWSVAEGGKAVDWLQQIIANYPQQTGDGQNTGKDIFDR